MDFYIYNSIYIRTNNIIITMLRPIIPRRSIGLYPIKRRSFKDKINNQFNGIFKSSYWLKLQILTILLLLYTVYTLVNINDVTTMFAAQNSNIYTPDSKTETLQADDSIELPDNTTEIERNALSRLIQGLLTFLGIV